MKGFRNVLSGIYLVATVCSLVFFANMGEFPLTIGAGSWMYALGLMLLSEDYAVWIGLLGIVWFMAFWVLLLISAILAYRGRFGLLCVFACVDALITAGYLVLWLLLGWDAMQQTFVLDGIVTVLFSVAMIAVAVICGRKEMQTDVDEFLKERSINPTI